MARLETDPFLAEILGQPGALRRAAEGVREQRDHLEALARISPRARRIVFTGMGSSYFACYPALTELCAAGVDASMTDAAELLHFRRPALGGDALLIAVSQSGRSAELVRLLEDSRAWGPTGRPRVVSVTNGLGSPVAEAADFALDTRAGPEVAPSTMTFAASLVVLGALAGTLGPDADARDVVARVAEESERTADRADRLLEAPDARAAELRQWLGERPTLVLLGRGRDRAAAEMGSLILQEAARVPAAAMQTGQFRHGPLEIAGSDLAAIVVAAEPTTRPLDLGLAGELRGLGAEVLLVGPRGEDVGAWFDIAEASRLLSPTLSVMPAQLLAWRLALDRGLEPGTFTVATKTTTRE